MAEEAAVRAELGFADTIPSDLPAEVRRRRTSRAPLRLHDRAFPELHRRLRPRGARAAWRPGCLRSLTMFRGRVRSCPTHWLTPVGDPVAMAAKATEILAQPAADLRSSFRGSARDREPLSLERNCGSHCDALSRSAGLVRPMILQIVPRPPGSHEGVGDYASALATRPRAATRRNLRVRYRGDDRRSELAAAVVSANAVILHYVNYGYDPRGHSVMATGPVARGSAAGHDFP